MNVINVYEPVVSQLSELTTASRPAPRATIGATFTLRKSGARPISFSGRLLATTMAIAPARRFGTS